MNDKFIHDLYKDKYANVYVLIKSFIYSSASYDIQDCIQNVFLEAMRSEELEKHPNIDGWLFLTAKNISFHFNREYLKNNHLNIDDFHDLESDEDLLSQFIEDDNTRRMIQMDAQKKLFDYFNEDEKIFYYLKYRAKADTKEISKILNISENTVFSRNARLISKAKRFIDKLLK